MSRLAPSRDLVDSLLEELGATFDLDFRLAAGGTLGEAVEERLRNIRWSETRWGTEGEISDVASRESPSLRFFYRPHLFPGMDPRLRLAHELQFDLLPTALPSGRPLRIASVLESYCHLSGDLLGWQPVGEDGLLLWIVDISGHGIRAGLSAAVVRVLLAEGRDETEPAALAAWLDRSFRASRNPQDPRVLYATGLFIRIDGDGTGSWCSAGHPPGYLRKADGKLERLEAQGPPLALVDGCTWAQSPLRLDAGDHLFLSTDGLAEHPDAEGRFFGLERVEELLVEDFPDPESLARRVYLAAAEHGSIQHLEDDVTYLVVGLASDGAGPTRNT